MALVAQFYSFTIPAMEQKLGQYGGHIVAVVIQEHIPTSTTRLQNNTDGTTVTHKMHNHQNRQNE